LKGYVETRALKLIEENLKAKGMGGVFMDYLELTKPKLTLLVMSTCLVGFVMAPGAINYLNAVYSLFFISLIVGGACALNCFIERDVDSKMERTRERVLPSGKLSPNNALIFGIFFITIGHLGLFFSVNPITCVLGLIASVLYLFSYTPMKQKSEYAVYVGAIPGAIPPIMGWTSVTGAIDLFAYCLFGVLLIWQLPHFWAISIYHAKDYECADIKVYPNQKGLGPTKIYIFIFTILLGLVSILPVYFNIAKAQFLWLALALNITFIIQSSLGLFFKYEEVKLKKWAKMYFYASIIYLPLLLGGMIFFK